MGKIKIAQNRTDEKQSVASQENILYHFNNDVLGMLIQFSIQPVDNI